MATKKAPDQTRILSIEDVDGAEDIDERAVPIPQWHGSVRLRTPTLERIELLKKQATFKGTIDQDHFVALIMVECMIEPKIDLATYERWTTTKSAVAMAMLQREVTKICGLSEAAVEDADKRNGARSDIAGPILLGPVAVDEPQAIPARGDRR